MSLLDQITNNKINLDITIQRLKLLFDSPLSSIEKNSYGGLTFDKDIDIDTIYESENVTITRGIWHKAGQIYPNHKHAQSVEYLICTEGKFIVNFLYGTRLMSQGECMTIPLGVDHSVIPMEDESKMLGICIPPEIAYLMPVRERIKQ